MDVEGIEGRRKVDDNVKLSIKIFWGNCLMSQTQKGVTEKGK
jgi:hypothetical protein